jgi:hypothetical protein
MHFNSSRIPILELETIVCNYQLKKLYFYPISTIWIACVRQYFGNLLSSNSVAAYQFTDILLISVRSGLIPNDKKLPE